MFEKDDKIIVNGKSIYHKGKTGVVVSSVMGAEGELVTVQLDDMEITRALWGYKLDKQS